jgi:hypothetical protein
MKITPGMQPPDGAILPPPEAAGEAKLRYPRAIEHFLGLIQGLVDTIDAGTGEWDNFELL